jgi:hypothetical protein
VAAVAELIIAKNSSNVIVQALIGGLPDAGWADVYVSTGQPGLASGHERLPSAFIRVTRGGGGRLNRVTDSASSLIECWHDGSNAEGLAQAAIGVLCRAAGQRQRFAGGFIRGIDNLFGPTDFPDPLVPSHDRSQFHGDFLISTN